MKKVAVISAILEDPTETQQEFNDTIASFKGIIKGRMGIPIPEHGVSLISLAVVGNTDEINSLTGKLGKINKVSVKTAMSKRDFT